MKTMRSMSRPRAWTTHSIEAGALWNCLIQTSLFAMSHGIMPTIPPGHVASFNRLSTVGD